MRRIWWLLTLLVVIVGVSAYHWRSDIAAMLSGGPGAAQAASASPPSIGANAPSQGSAARTAGGTRAAGGSGGRPTGVAGGGAAGGSGGQSPFAVATAVAVTGALPETRQTIGWIVSESATNLTSPSAGVVQEIDAVAGSDVKAGDVLVKLDARTQNAALVKDRAALQRDQATLDQAKRAMATAETLAQRGADTAISAQQADTAEAVAEATVGVDNAQIATDQVAQDNTVIKAPFDGRIGALQVAVGSLVQPATAVVTLTQMAPVDVQFSVAEADLAALRAAMDGGTAAVTVTPSGAGKGAGGKVTFLESSVDRASGTVQARGKLDNADRTLWPGQSVNVSLDLGSRSGLVLVPTVAVVPQSTGSVVYVVKPDRTIDVRKVTVAGSDGDTTALSAGVQAGEHLVVEGQFNLASGQRVSETQATAAVTAPAKAG